LGENSVNTFKLTNGSFLKIDIISASCFRLRMSNRQINNETNAYARYGIFDFTGDRTVPEMHDNEDSISFATDNLNIDINRTTCHLKAGINGNESLLETSSPLWIGKNGGFSLSVNAKPGESFYGLGDVNRETLEKRGTMAQIWVKNVKSYVPVPFLMSSNGWAVFCNTTSRHNFDICSSDPDVLKIWGYYGEIDVIFFTGDSYSSLLDQYTAITGKPCLLPKFGYGLTFVCNQQANAREMIDDAMNFRNRGIPCDVIGLEPGWMETYYDKSVNKKFDEERFYIPSWCSNSPDAIENLFFGALKRLGFKLSLWMCCDYDLSFEEERKAVIVKEVVRPDDEMDYLPSKDDFEQDMNIGHEPLSMDEYTVRDEGFFEHLKKFVDLGARAFKLDGAWQVNEHPDRKWGNGMDDVEMHNLYPLLLSKQMSTGFSEHTGNRSMIYSSGGFAGIQQYAATWAGDTGGGPKPLASMLNHAMSGHVNTSCDMLVFTKEGIHFGFLQSWSQVCSWAYWRHPWLLGKELEGIFREYARLRYALIPYIYSTAYEAYLHATPIMRPLPFVYPDDEAARNVVNEYLFGENFLVSCFNDSLYLPEGDWIDYFTGRKYKGPFTGTYTVPEGKGGGLFVRAGAIIPMQTVLDYVDEKTVDELTVEIYPSGESSFTIYDDDGITLGYREGIRSEILITCSDDEKGIHLSVSERKGTFEGMPENLTISFRIHAPEPASVNVGLTSVPFTCSDGLVTITIPNAEAGAAIHLHY
jgi:alpha-glucosidase (family GH31 glycosyl hydrolase)